MVSLGSSFDSRTVVRCWRAGSVVFVLALLLGAIYPASAAGAPSGPGNPDFQRIWQRTDRPVLDGITARTWMWGPEANSQILYEAYVEAPGGQRHVQYFDKARMEITNPNGDAGSIWYVTNGLLVVELITGDMQIGDSAFEQRQPALVNVAGDFDDPTGPTYQTFADLLDAAPLAPGASISRRVTRSGAVTTDPALASQGVTAAIVDEVTNHAIAAPFWTFMTSSGVVYEDGQATTAALFENPYFATGRPVTEAYWAEVKVGGTYRDVLMQCFERRCLTYTPGNPEGFVVEAGNVGQHYYQWRYGSMDETPEPPASEPPANEPPAEEPPANEPPAEEPPVTPDPATRYQFVNAFGGAVPTGADPVNPTGAAVAPNGNLYVVDGGDRVQVFDSKGVWLKSWGGAGTAPGKFDNPQGITVDPSGFVYVADFANHRIQKFDPDGALITYWPVDGFPSDVAYAPTYGQIYVTDMNKHMVRVYSTDGAVAGTFGEYGSDPGQLFAPSGLTIGPDNNVYVADTVNNRVQIFSLTGEYTGGFGTGGTGPGQFNFPSDVIVATGGGIVYEFKVYVADSLNDRIQVFSLDPVLAPAANRSLAALNFSYSGQLGATGTEPGQFLRPESLDLDQYGNLVIADMRNDRIQKLNLSGQPVDVLSDAGRGRFQDDAFDLALTPDGRVFVADTYSLPGGGYGGGVHVFGPDGAFTKLWADVHAIAATTDADGNLLILNANGRIETYSPDGQLLDAIGSENTNSRTLLSRGAIALDAQGNIYILATTLGSIQKFSPDGVYLDSWGAPGSQPGQMLSPYDLAVHGDEIYVADAANNRVQVFDLAGNLLRGWGEFGTGDGQLQDPMGLAVDAEGYVYVSDSGNNRVQKFTPDGEFLAKWGLEGSNNGEFRLPADIILDPAGNVYVADSGNLRVQKFAPVS